MLKQASKKPSNEGVVWIQADAASLPFPSESFDHVICANSFHYFPAPLKALREAYRVVRPGASLVLVDWCDDYLSCKLCKIWLRLTDPAFCRTYSFAQCKSLLEDSGFALVRGDRFRAGWIWGMMRFVCRRPA
ncbi:MAG: class I SAM-dependent methyltransferase [Planctomycetes bacterium]|nr:class I SAM-dependent methyltransferase [Planctomycetota bacterium]